MMVENLLRNFLGIHLTFGFRSANLNTEQTMNMRPRTVAFPLKDQPKKRGLFTPSQHGAFDEYPLCVFGPGGDFRTAWLPGSLPIGTAQARGTSSNPGAGSWVLDRLGVRRVCLPPWPGTAYGVPKAIRLWWSKLTHQLAHARVEGRRLRALRSLWRTGMLPLVVSEPNGLLTCLENEREKNKKNPNPGNELLNAPPTRDSYNDPRRSADQWLFPDVAGNRRRARHQQNHRIRARRNTHPQENAYAAEQQGTLFGTDLLSPAA